MSRVKAVAFSALLLLTILMGTINTSAEDQTWEAGFVEWMVEDTHRLYVEGNDTEDSVLQRSSPDSVGADSQCLVHLVHNYSSIFTYFATNCESDKCIHIYERIFSAILENSPEKSLYFTESIDFE